MTEEIIINYVNVAGCKFLCGNEGDKICCADDIREAENPFQIFCEDNPNCYYKQLKQAEIEIEKLKGVDGSVHPDSAYYKITRLEQENKELKEEKQAIKSYLGIEAKTILKRLEELDEWKHDDKLLLWKYRSALEEIREIADKCKECLNEDDDCGCDYLRIKRRIDEVLGDEND